MSFENHRKLLFSKLEDNSFVLCYAGIPLHCNEDEYAPFTVNSQFYWLTGLERENMAFIMVKQGETEKEILFIEEYDPEIERWTGKMPTKEEVTAISGIEEVRYVTELSSSINRFMNYGGYIDYLYMDIFRLSAKDLPDYNFTKAKELREAFPALTLKDLHRVIAPLRQCKDQDEVSTIKKAIDITKKGLELVMSTLKPDLYEYEAQAVFEYYCKRSGCTKQAFETIAGSGKNGCMMHYCENNAKLKDGSLLLLDLGAKYKNYSSDITRTYPVNGKFTQRQRAFYELVLKANRAVAAAAKPGMTMNEINDVAKEVLAEGLLEMGMIEDKADVGRYYMHSVSHSMGIDTHDIELRTEKFEPGWVITDEPGLYIDEEEIGIRIEDDLLITEDGCIVLSEDIIRDPDEIEAFMAANKKEIM